MDALTPVGLALGESVGLIVGDWKTIPVFECIVVSGLRCHFQYVDMNTLTAVGLSVGEIVGLTEGD